jgi:hypothetical protein
LEQKTFSCAPPAYQIPHLFGTKFVEKVIGGEYEKFDYTDLGIEAPKSFILYFV